MMTFRYIYVIGSLIALVVFAVWHKMFFVAFLSIPIAFILIPTIRKDGEEGDDTIWW